MANNTFDTEKIKIMTKIAAYQKNEARRDNHINAYFLHDYIYKCNMQTRICVFFGCLNIAAINALYRFFYLGDDPFSLNYSQELKKIAFYIIPVLIAYTVLGTIKASAEYMSCQKRLAGQRDLIDKLNPEKAKPPEEPAANGEEEDEEEDEVDPYLYYERRRRTYGDESADI